MKFEELPIISVVGPTAAGKTDFALQLADELLGQTDATGVDLISADSRQVYQGLEILSGADIPDGFVNRGKYFEKNQLRLWGVSMIEPEAEWSVAHFQAFAQKIIDQAIQDQRAVIIVGGTGLYHDRLFETDLQLRIPPNENWRNQAEEMTVAQLQQELQRLSSNKFQAMNHSDQLNPRRLIRAVEIELARAQTKADQEFTRLADESAGDQSTHKHVGLNHIYLGVAVPLAEIEHKIKLRVKARFEQGAMKEVEAILANNHLLEDRPVLSMLGLSEILAFLNQEITVDQCLQLWALHEFQYAKRQLTWWKRRDVKWIDANATASAKLDIELQQLLLSS